MAEPTVAEEEAHLRERLAALAKNRREREATEALDAGAILQGVRLVVPGSDEGVTLVLTPDEAKPFGDLIRQIVRARVQEAAR